MTSQAQQQAAAADTKQSFHPCEYEMVPTDGQNQPVAGEIDLEPRIAKLFGLGRTLDQSVQAVTKTMTFQGKLATSDHQPVATLDDVNVTATKMNDPHTGVPFVHVTLDYFATSHGWRTGRGGTEPWGLSNHLYFKNSAGGIVYSQALNTVFVLQCGWNRQHRFHYIVDRSFVGWFDVWGGVTHSVSGSVFRC